MNSIDLLLDFKIGTGGFQGRKKQVVKKHIRNYINNIYKEKVLFNSDSRFEFEINYCLKEKAKRETDLDNLTKILLDGVKNTNMFPFEDSVIDKLIISKQRSNKNHTFLRIRTI